MEERQSSPRNEREVDQKRQSWLSVLTQQSQALLQYETLLKAYSYDLLRAPEIGMAMVKGKTSGEGQVFNVGEVTVTRSAVRLQSGEIGFGYLIGRDKKASELIALADAYLQSDQAEIWQEQLLEPLETALIAQKEALAKKVQTTKVDFFTLVRGED
ncbi:phosphonate C-P lyase system protein PhnG [Ignatzschineria sp. LJL83]